MEKFKHRNTNIRVDELMKSLQLLLLLLKKFCS